MESAKERGPAGRDALSGHDRDVRIDTEELFNAQKLQLARRFGLCQHCVFQIAPLTSLLLFVFDKKHCSITSFHES